MSKLNWGLVGGGEGSQIGPAHRLGAQADGHFRFVAGALDHNPDKGRAYAQSLGIAPDRAYGDWRAMLAGERARDDRIDLVTVATPNATHFEITRAFLEAGFNVLCEKPMTMTVEEGEEIVRVAEASGTVCAVNYCYSAYPMARQMRAMVANGDLGTIRLVVANFSHGHHADARDQDNPRVRWRYDPAQAGVSGQMADCGIHALHLASFVTGDEVAKLSADFASCVPGRELEDDAMVNFRTEGGIVGRLWTSTVAIGRQHGLTLEVYGEKGGLRWAQEQPNQVLWQPLGGRTEILEKGDGTLTADAARLSRVVIGSPEGFPLAVANIYVDLAEVIGARRDGRAPDPAALHYPKATDGARSIAAVHSAVASADAGGEWVDARPPTMR
ncbi:MAG: Gfo/Idh/MocA family oxidoreductase [Roseitalea sp.]|jgi:predicted dehydrogenase|nr:Gfo/Idh/MocA family oxidoreductase [Roseitalea sp.]MBO6720305.1 Gfo/Idh/MocA family oxidoreductase [Roseitalea sp.]MBO6742665.1 Gfo/Idh/MocA family oxidoreductase [Roseitalea sp.]